MLFGFQLSRVRVMCKLRPAADAFDISGYFSVSELAKIGSFQLQRLILNGLVRIKYLYSLVSASLRVLRFVELEQ